MKVQWFYHWSRYLLFKCFGFDNNKVCSLFTKRRFVDQEYVNNEIIDKLKDRNPFMVCRIGTCEAFAMRTFAFEHRKNLHKALHQLCTCAGFFPEEVKYINRFVEEMERGMRQADICGTLPSPFDDHFIHENLSEYAKVSTMGSMVPITMKKPWTSELKGKRVLVIHPFAQTIAQQYEQREKLFSNKEMLPVFDLVTFKAVQTSAGESDERFQTWFDALNYMKDEIKNIHYDIALLGCGAYGLPLAGWIKEQGKQAIHVGGGLQLLFGIRGKRWDEMEEVKKLYNNYWVYPSLDEKPKGANLVEGACYWG